MTATPVRMTVHWSVPPGETRPLTAALHSLMVVARAERGCVACSLSTELGDSAALHYVQEWETEDDMRRQLRSHWFVSFASLIERATSRPQVTFSVPAGSCGLEYAEQARKQHRAE